MGSVLHVAMWGVLVGVHRHKMKTDSGRLRPDCLNRVTTMVDGSGTNAYTYTSGDQLLTEDGPFASDTLTNAYVNRLRTSLVLQQPTGLWTNKFVYDAAARLTNITSPAGVFGYPLVKNIGVVSCHICHLDNWHWHCESAKRRGVRAPPPRKRMQTFLQDWRDKANQAGIGQLLKMAKTLRIHATGILAYGKHPITSGKLEDINNKINKIKTLTKRSYGFHDENFFILRLLSLHHSRYELLG